MTVYLRLTGAKVPAIYGPSADEKAFREHVSEMPNQRAVIAV
jgi:hypothetical protein